MVMKRKKILLIVFILIMITSVQSVFAAPYITQVVNKNGKLSFSPSLYEPLTTIEVALENPTDIFIDDKNQLYVLESQRVSRMDGETNTQKVLIDNTYLKSATSFFVDKDYIYVADKGAEKVKIFSLKGELIREIGKPNHLLYGAKEGFKPIKIVVNNNQDLFIVSDGNTNGVIQMDIEGNFIGYFGRNDATSSFFQKLKEKVLKDTPLGKLIRVTPPSVYTLDIDEKGIIYVSSVGNVEERVRKLNMAGKNIFINKPIPSKINKIDDIVVDDDFIMMIDSEQGSIIISDKNGDCLGVFGSKTNETPVMGLFLSPIAIEMDTYNNVYVLDNTLKNIQVFSATLLMDNIYKATHLFNEGRYEETKVIWQEIIERNPRFALANNTIGNIALKSHQYKEAMKSFYRGNNKEGYSEALWEIRQLLINQYLGIAMLIAIAVYILKGIYKKCSEKSRLVQGIKSKVNKLYRFKILSDLRLIRKTLQKPNHVFYNIRVKDNVSITTAFFALGMLVVIKVISETATSYLFTEQMGQRSNLIGSFLSVVGVTMLFVVSNFLITSILEGEGKFKHIFIGTIYALAPMLLFMLPIALFSNVLTLNDVFLLQLLQAMMYGGTAILIIIMVIEVHNYGFTEAVKVLILTVLTMLLIVIIGVSLYALFTQILLFFERTLMEVLIRA